MPADYRRVHRLLHIITLIQSNDGYTAAKLAETCGCAERTIYRDLEILEGLNIPYFFDEEKKCYKMRRDYFMPPVQLTLDEALALVALAQQAGGADQIPFLGSAERAIEKLRSVLPSRVRDEVARLDGHLAIKLAAASAPEAGEDVYRKMRDALTRRTALRCSYAAVNGKRDERATFDFHPYALFFSQRSWYAIGYHCGRKDIRCLKLVRFTGLQPTGQTYQIPKDFSVEKHLGLAWRMIRGKKAYDVELYVDAGFAETLLDTHWHSTQDFEDHPDGSATVRFRVEGLEEIVWWVLSFGPHVRVKKPKELADRVADLADAIARRYRGTS